MKHLITILLPLALCAGLLTSCKKTYTCTCYTVPGNTSVTTKTVKARKKADVQCFEDLPPPNRRCDIE